MSTNRLPPFVCEVKNAIVASEDHELSEVSAKLIDEKNADLVKMWWSLYRGPTVDRDDLYVWTFLQQAHDACHLPSYTYLTHSERSELCSRVQKISGELQRILIANDLNFHLVASHDTFTNGIFVYEDLSESRQHSMDQSGFPKVAFDALLGHASNRLLSQMHEVRALGKKGQAQRARVFCRILSARIFRLRGTPLLEVVATAANTLYGTDYRKGDISNLLNR